jgi:hypothetical protein
VVRIGNENGINPGFREVRIVRFADDDLDVVLTLQQSPQVEKKQGKSSEIDRNHFSFRPDRIRKFQRKISRARPEIDDGTAGFEIESLNYLDRPLPLIAFGFDCG